MIVKREFLYTPKGKNRTLHIYLPQSYGTTEQRYPVMYFFDGHNLYRDQDATYGKSWGLESFLDHWGKDMIVVGMECSHEGSQRLDEYSPYTFPMGHWGMVHGIGRQTMDWIVNDIKPMIDREYRTYSFREATGIAGSSMGGLMSLYAAAAYNQVFSKATGNPITLLKFLHGLMPNITSSMSKTDFWYMGLRTVVHGMPSMDHIRLPLEGEWQYGTTSDGMSVIQFNDNVLAQHLHNYIFNDITPQAIED